MSATAKIQLMLEIDTEDSWGEECSIKQIKEQAVQSAKRSLNKALSNDPKIKIKIAAKCIGVTFF